MGLNDTLNAPGPTSGQIPGGKGYFNVPTGLQRLYEYDLYSSFRYAAATNINGAVKSQFFGYNQSAGTGGSFASVSLSETNMVIAAMTPGGESYEVSAIAMEILGATNVTPLIADLRAIMRLGVASWNFSNNTLIQVCPIAMIGNGGAGVYGFSADTGTPVTQPNNGNGSSYWVYQNQVICLPATQPWNLQVEWGSGGQTGAITITAEIQIRMHLFNQARTAIAIA